MIHKGAIEEVTAANRQRPGPFGPAWALIPRDQRLETVASDAPAHEALDRMIDGKYSQLPVTDGKQDPIVGVFSHRAFSQRSLDLRCAKKIDPLQLSVEEFMEKPAFISGETYIDTGTDWSEIDYVLVGERENPLGILTIADVWGRLNDSAEAFVLIYEIEHELRDLIQDVVDEAELAGLIASMKVDARASPPQSLTEFSFSQYNTLICNRANWHRFEEAFGQTRELVDTDLDSVKDLRNDVFHFRRGITNTDTDRLRRFRDRLRLNREIWNRRHAGQSESG